MSCPYRGLSAFREQDAPLFFGREEFTALLIHKVTSCALVGVIGASGSGKSSLVSAGLVPALKQQQNWLVANFRPGARPFDALAASVALADPDMHVDDAFRLGQEFKGESYLYSVFDHITQRRPLLLCADQFEELFTLCTDVGMAKAFLQVLVDLTRPHGPSEARCRTVITLRGDFYGHVVGHRPFSDALQDGIVHLPPMTRDELRRAIAQPSKVAGADFEAGLVERILDDVGDEPGNLPLLEFSLMLLWNHQRHRLLTHAAYESIGKLDGAIARQAENAYYSLAPEEQYTARQIVTRLIRVGRPQEEGTDARRRATRAELASLPRAKTVIAALTDARLLVTDFDRLEGTDTVEVAHEAVLRSWDRLQSWLVEDRQFLLWQQRLRTLSEEWRLSNNEDEALLRGRLLQEAEGWLTSRGREEISPAVLEYIDRSCDLRKREAATQALTSAEMLRVVHPDEVTGIIRDLAAHREIVEPHLREAIQQAPPAQAWRFQVALLQWDARQTDALLNQITEVSPEELLIIRSALEPHKLAVVPRLWRMAESRNGSIQSRFRSACLLAELDPEGLGWQSIQHSVARMLVQENPLHLHDWVGALKPVGHLLIEPLQTVFVEERGSVVVRAAMAALLSFAANRPALLAQLVTESDRSTYEEIYTALTVAEGPSGEGRSVLRTIVAQSPVPDMVEDERVRHGRRRSLAACTLLRFDDRETILSVFEGTADPEARTQFMYEARSRRIESRHILETLDLATNDSQQFGLLLSLGAFDLTEIPDSRKQGLIEQVQHWYVDHPSSKVHGACGWLLRRWGFTETVSAIDKLAIPYDSTGYRQWFVVSVEGIHYTFVTFPPGEFVMGSPESEKERSDYEGPRHPVRLTRGFAACTREVSRGEFERCMDEEGLTGLPNIDEWSPLSTEPVVALTWYEAVRYCEWFSRLSKINSDAIAYESLGRMEETGDCEFHPERAGFRLPTEAEWEYAARSGTITPFSFGSDHSLLDHYGWSQTNSGLKTHEACALLPNPRGLFNIHCNCWEWCHDWYTLYSEQLAIDPRGPDTGEEMGGRRVLRGGCWNLSGRYGRSSCRNAHLPTNRNYYISLRLVCTLPQ